MPRPTLNRYIGNGVSPTFSPVAWQLSGEQTERKKEPKREVGVRDYHSMGLATGRTNCLMGGRMSKTKQKKRGTRGNARTHERTHRHRHRRTDTDVQTHRHTHTYRHTDTQTETQTQTQTQTHMHTHTHTHTHRHTDNAPS
jgi:hypothetical protein